MKTAKEIIKRLWVNKYKSTRFSYSPLNQDIDIVEKAMIEYANQKQVSDEEIERLITMIITMTNTTESDKQYCIEETVKEWAKYNQLTNK